MKVAMNHLSLLSFFSSALYEDRLIEHNLLRWKYCHGFVSNKGGHQDSGHSSAICQCFCPRPMSGAICGIKSVDPKAGVS